MKLTFQNQRLISIAIQIIAMIIGLSAAWIREYLIWLGSFAVLWAITIYWIIQGWRIKQDIERLIKEKLAKKEAEK